MDVDGLLTMSPGDEGVIEQRHLNETSWGINGQRL